MSHVRITDDQLDRTLPIESTIGTVEIDLSGDEATIVLPPDVPVTIERGGN